MLRLGLKAKIFCHGLEAQVLGLRLASLAVATQGLGLCTLLLQK